MKSLGVFGLTLESRWRREKLLILCYHGISLEDEHKWDPVLYMPAEQFEGRLALRADKRCTVLQLGEALERLYRKDLPPRSVVLTFDDGGFDFLAKAYPVLQNFGFPVTVYQTTYYSEYNRPVFDSTSSYLLWKGSGTVVDGGVIGVAGHLDLTTPAGVKSAWRQLLTYAREHLDARGKDALLGKLAAAVGIDYAEIVRKRLFCLMTPQEVCELARAGVDFQLHTHRHRTPFDRELFVREIRDNRERITGSTGCEPMHFCYPLGFHRPEFLPWLSEERVVSATTCDSGLASRASKPLLLPRVVDQLSLAPIEIEGWITGCAAWLPTRPRC